MDRRLSKQIKYEVVESVRGYFFYCEKLSAKLSVSACIESYRVSRTLESIQNGRRYHCRYCPIGQLHSGAPVASSRVYGALICPRCRRSCRRLTTGVCLSCYNRAAELAKGKNARGTYPAQLKPLYDLIIACSLDGMANIQSFKRVVDIQECMLRVLRTDDAKILFGRPGLGGDSSCLQRLHGEIARMS